MWTLVKILNSAAKQTLLGILFLEMCTISRKKGCKFKQQKLTIVVLLSSMKISMCRIEGQVLSRSVLLILVYGSQILNIMLVLVLLVFKIGCVYESTTVTSQTKLSLIFNPLTAAKFLRIEIINLACNREWTFKMSSSIYVFALIYVWIIQYLSYIFSLLEHSFSQVFLYIFWGYNLQYSLT